MEEILKIDADEEELYGNDIIAATAYKNFGIRYMFPWQRLVVSNIMEAYEYHKMYVSLPAEEKLEYDKDNEDSFCKGRQIVLLPTGAGKSLCFQIPALLLDGPSLIIYPLLALMTDQQRRMEEGSLRSVTFRGGQTEEEQKENFEKIKNGAKIILANPEVLQSESLLEKLKSVGIRHIAIDEAHCVSEWGDSFRPAYLGLGKVIEKLNPPVITAFTATASPPVLSRVAEILFNGEAHIVRSDSDRPNIHYYVQYAAAKKKAALILSRKELRPMIIFCGTRNNAEDMAYELNACFGDGSARFYHAGLSKEEKEDTEKWFYNSKDGVLTATCAYGMGVDKKDIHTVVHIEASATAEAYIQEAGRGGRDGSVAKAILLWSLEDSLEYSMFPPDSRQASMKNFAETTDCRRQVLLDALGAEQAVCSGCDLCEVREKLKSAENLRGLKKVKYIKFIEKAKPFIDWQYTYKLVRHRKNFYTNEELENDIFEKFNETSVKEIGKKIWTHSDTAEVVMQLEQSGKIKKNNILWKDRLYAVKENIP